MINVDISNIWGEVALPDLLAMEEEVIAAHEALMEQTGIRGISPEEEARILQAADRIRKDSGICVILGVEEGCLGARAAMELLQTADSDPGDGNPRLLFGGNDLSTRRWHRLAQQLKDQDFSLIVISGTPMATETAVAFRSLRWMLERKYGTDEANRRIYAVTVPGDGDLGQLAREEGWECFDRPAGSRDGLSVLTAAGLLPMAVAGIDIREVRQGAAEAEESYALGSFENPLWQYAAIRNLLYRGGKSIELFSSFEPGFRLFCAWWRQLFGMSEGKQGKGLFPATAEFTEDLYALGQLLRQGQGNLFETVVRFDPPENRVLLGSDWKDLAGLNCLEGKTLDFAEESAFQAAVSAHVDGGVPVIVVDCGELTARKVGELFCFLGLSRRISAGLMGVDPDDRSGLEPYRQNLRQLLGMPEPAAENEKLL